MHKPAKRSFFMHPFEMGIAGFSQAGKTTLLCSVVEALKKDYKVGYIKHSHHGFNADHEGKDTDTLFRAGAAMVSIQDQTGWFYRENNERHKPALRQLLIHHDMVLIEGYKEHAFPKIVYLDENLSILDHLEESVKTEIVFYVGQAKERPAALGGDKEYIHADETEKIVKGILKFFFSRAEKTPLYGLVLCGGKSTRMGEDKSALKYFDTHQVSRCIQTLTPFVKEVFVSNRVSQADALQFQDSRQIHDRFQDMGPLGGILSAMETYPGAAWMIMAVDMPLAEKKHVQALCDARDPFKSGTVYINSEGLPEPLFSILEPKSRSLFYQMLSDGTNCPRHFFKLHPARYIHVKDDRFLKNFNTPQDKSLFKGLC